jgi:DNA-binding response OmpR family regulator
MSAQRVLIAEDDPDISSLISLYLQRAGYQTEVVASGRDVLARFSEQPFDLLILDLMLPELDGLDVCRALRARRKTTSIPIIIVTARAEEADRVAGLELGADDYVTKPFSPRELVARVGALLRRASRAGPTEGPLCLGSLMMDRERHVVTYGGALVQLTAKEFRLLEYFLLHRGRVLSRDLLLTDVWGYHYAVNTRTIDVHVRRLREKVPLLADVLLTVQQFGYKLVDEVQS